MKEEYKDLYIKAYRRHLAKALPATESGNHDKWTIYRTIFYGVRYHNAIGKDYSSEQELKLLLSRYDALFYIMGLVTPRELIKIFPIDKYYDGDKWQMKDYFSTMREIERLGIDKPIGENLIPLLMDYCNRELRSIIVQHTCLVSAYLRYQGKPGIAEQWADSIGLDTYIKKEDESVGATYYINRRAWKQLESLAFE